MEQALQIFSAIGDRLEVARAEGILQTQYLRLGELDKARKCAGRLEALVEELGPTGKWWALHHLATLRKASGDPQAALRAAERMLALAPQVEHPSALASSHRLVGLIYDDLSMYAKSLAHLEAASSRLNSWDCGARSLSSC